MTLFEFDQGILAGKGAGSYPDDGVLACTVGLDCSGFVSKAWATGHYTTSNLADTSTMIDVSALLAGDVFNDAGYHVAMFSSLLANGDPAIYESAGYNVHYTPSAGWSYLDGYMTKPDAKPDRVRQELLSHDIVVEATGNPEIGARIAVDAIARGTHVAMASRRFSKSTR